MLLDSPFKEIHALRLADDGTIYAAAVSGDRAAKTAPSRHAGRRTRRARRCPTVSTEITAIAVVDTARRRSSPPATSRERPRRGNRGAIYRIRPDGLWDTLWETGDDCAVRSR